MKYHTNTHGPNKAAYAAGLVAAVTAASGNGTNQVLLLGHTFKMIEGGVIEDVLGQARVKNLSKSRQMKIDDATVYLETEKTRSAFSRGVIFVPFVSSALLNKAIADHRATDIVYVPWTDEERQQYLERHSDSVEVPLPKPKA